MVPIMLWTAGHRAFAVEAYFSNGRSISPFTFPSVSANRTCASGVLKIHVNFTKPLSIVSMLSFGAQFRRSGSLVLIFLRKTSALSRWMQLDTGRWSKNFSFHIWKKLTSGMCGFNKTEPRPTQYGPRWNCSENTFLAASSLSEAIYLGRRALQIWLHSTSSYGVIWSLSFTTIDHGS